ncbi:URC4/urg3 family protein [Aquincola sp. J276]|uniref:URC4/urg3 family protein n=1 Tax=Aquincola sp. J276 TaxID=2898432 RepID=UPI002151F191|nr:URC4/urg3 family protein [Aquincola sp. J276]MCR5865887.1 URC4/urg3 family protein [Aquincola sp. J276]
MSELQDAAAVQLLRQAATIRERCRNITHAVQAERSPHFRLDLGRLDAVADRVAALTRSRFPRGGIPYHSRWRHFEAGGVDRKAEMDALLAGRSPAEVARARIDLALVSVLLDAGAGPQWSYAEVLADGTPGQVYSRSEGLGVASFRAFVAGRFSSDPAEPLRVDAQALRQLDAALLAEVFRADDTHPLVGLEGRAALLRRLGEALAAQPEAFGAEGRPGRLFDLLAPAGTVQAADILKALLDAFSGIWPSGQRFGAAGLPVGDAWAHPLAGGSGPSAGWVPFHKLSQWLSYSLLEPFEWAGVPVAGLDALTGLPEYRNGGLLLDAGVIVPRDPGFADRPRTPGEPWTIEWRALTVVLLDELAPRVRARLGASAQQMPLARVLEGGTWQAGRQIAAELRPGGGPPVQIDSDGTVF